MQSIFVPFERFADYSGNMRIEDIRKGCASDYRELVSSISGHIYKSVVSGGDIHICYDKSGQVEGVEVFDKYLARGVRVKTSTREFALPLISHNTLKSFLEDTGMEYRLNGSYGVSIPALGIATFHPHFDDLMAETGDCQIASAYFSFDQSYIP